MELKACNGWDHTHPLDEVQLEMRHRVRVKGWDSVKPAMRSSIQCVNPILVSIFELRSTFREWIMFAFCAHVLDHDSVIALEFYTKAIAMIDFVRSTWPDVPTSERGVICKTSFLFPLKRLALRAYLDVRAVILHRFSRANSNAFSQNTRRAIQINILPSSKHSPLPLSKKRWLNFQSLMRQDWLRLRDCPTGSILSQRVMRTPTRLAIMSHVVSDSHTGQGHGYITARARMRAMTRSKNTSRGHPSNTFSQLMN